MLLTAWLLCINGTLDDSVGVNYRSQVVLLSETNSGGRLALPWTVVRWGPSEQTDRLSLTWGERHRLWGGEIVTMQLRAGFLAMPWIMSIERDEEHYLRELTRTVPRATVAWRHLIYYLVRQNRLDEAQEAARHYLKLYPKGHEQALVVGMALKRVGRYREAIPFFEYVIWNIIPYMRRTNNWVGPCSNWVKSTEPRSSLKPLCH